MNRYKGIIIFCMTIFAAAFIAFVAIMQHNFMNPEFAATGTQAVSSTDETQEIETNKEEDVSGEIENKQNSADSSTDEEDEQNDEESEEETVTYSTKYVNVDSLNVRSGPSLDDEIMGVVTLDQEVEVEDYNDPDGWVQVTTEALTGYVNEKYLDDE
ncbi:SH3 domain-containing protein [Virgibacillus ainsalahensis]